MGGVFAALVQRQPDQRLALVAQVMVQVGPLIHHLLAQGGACLAVSHQRGGGRRPWRKPALQGQFSPGNGGPHRPQSVVKIEADGPYG